MPVRNLTDRPQIPRLGKIRLGDQSGRNNSPVNLPYFVVPPEVAAVHGEHPTELPVVFLSDDLEKIASQYYRAYNASSGLICKGDGFRADALLDADELRKSGGALTPDAWAHGATGGRQASANLQRQEIACAGMGYDGQPPCPMFAAKKCAIRGFYQFAIKDVPGLGVYQMDTGSMVSIRKLNGAIELSRAMLGGVAGVPMTLRRVQEDVAPDGKKKKVWMVMLEVDTSLSMSKLMALHAGPVAQALLPPVDESEPYTHGDEDAIEGEVVPPAARVEPAPAPSPAPPAAGCDHDPQYDDEGRLICRECGEYLPASAVEDVKPREQIDQFGRFRTAAGKVDGQKFATELAGCGLDVADLARVATPREGTTKPDVSGWLARNAAKTLEDLIREAEAAKKGAV